MRKRQIKKNRKRRLAILRTRMKIAIDNELKKQERWVEPNFNKCNLAI